MLRVRAQMQPWYHGVAFLITDGKAIADSITLTVRENKDEPFEPSFILPLEAAQELLNDLWNSGLRPNDKAENVGELRATKYHLEDMRKLVFDGGEKNVK